MHIKPEIEQEKGLSLRLLLAGVLAALAAPAHASEATQDYDATDLPSGAETGTGDTDIFIS